MTKPRIITAQSFKTKSQGRTPSHRLTAAALKKVTGFQNWPPTARDLAGAEARSAVHPAQLDAEIAADPKRAERVRQVRTEAEVAVHLYELRRRSGKTQAELAAAIGTTQSAVARIEHGKILRLDTIYKYAAACGQSVRIQLVADPISAVGTNVTYTDALPPTSAMQETQGGYAPVKAERKRPQAGE